MSNLQALLSDILADDPGCNPVLSTCPACMTPGAAYHYYGTLGNGIMEPMGRCSICGAAYNPGDDFDQMAMELTMRWYNRVDWVRVSLALSLVLAIVVMFLMV